MHTEWRWYPAAGLYVDQKVRPRCPERHSNKQDHHLHKGQEAHKRRSFRKGWFANWTLLVLIKDSPLEANLFHLLQKRQESKQIILLKMWFTNLSWIDYLFILSQNETIFSLFPSLKWWRLAMPGPAVHIWHCYLEWSKSLRKFFSSGGGDCLLPLVLCRLRWALVSSVKSRSQSSFSTTRHQFRPPSVTTMSNFVPVIFQEKWEGFVSNLDAFWKYQ